MHPIFMIFSDRLDSAVDDVQIRRENFRILVCEVDRLLRVSEPLY